VIGGLSPSRSGSATPHYRGQHRCGAIEFIGRFLKHVLPSRFVKIRHFGLTSSGNVNTKLQCARTLLPAVPADSSSAATDGHNDG
jgi:hypothetical protein